MHDFNYGKDVVDVLQRIDYLLSMIRGGLGVSRVCH